MRFSRRHAVWLAVGLAAGTMAARASLSLPPHLQHVDAASRAFSILFRPASLPAGTVQFRRPPRETRAALTPLIDASPSDTDLLALRAHEAEAQLDFSAAEQDWKRYAAAATDKQAGLLALSDYYHRRLQPREEVQALAEAAVLPSGPAERFLPVEQQRSWRAFGRIFTLVRLHQLPDELAMAQYRAWIGRYPKEAQPYDQFLAFLAAHGRYNELEQALAEYQRVFPQNEATALRMRADLARQRNGIAAALAVYDQSFRPDWTADQVSANFAMLREAGQLRSYLERVRKDVGAKPLELTPVVKLFYYYQQQNDLPSAQRVLAEYRQRKEASPQGWSAVELQVISRLFRSLGNRDEAARYLYALYSLPNADPGAVEGALSGLAELLLSAPEQPLRFGSGDLSYYRDIATLDPYPGFLNGILSLILNTTEPAYRYATQDQTAQAYFHRVRAAELVALLDRRFPQSAARAGLHAQLIEAFAAYGDSDAVLKQGQQYLTSFPQAPQRVQVAFLMAEAHARKGQTQPEFTLYDSLLRELAGRAEGVPIGPGAVAPASREGSGDAPESAPSTPASSTVRSADYVRVLDRYLSRLTSLKRITEALAVYRRELDRNPDDPGLYDRLAGFLIQNNRAAEVEQVYRQALQRFPDSGWSHKLARWYLRRKERTRYAALASEVSRTFSGTALEDYFAQVVTNSGIDAALAVQVNLFAHQRFPYDLVFVRNLLALYAGGPTANNAERLKLLRQYWSYDDDLRGQYFEQLSRTRQLDAQLATVRAAKPTAAAQPAAVQFLAEAEAWRSHFEAAAPVLRSLTPEYPADRGLLERAASLYRSLAAYDSQHIATAVALEEGITKADPRDREALARVGDIYGDRSELAKAKPYWERMAALEPGNPEGYLQAATVFWDYYQFADAARLIEQGRQQLRDPALHAFELGAIYENQHDYGRALTEYARGARNGGADSQARARLLALARRPALRAEVDRLTSAGNPDAEAVLLRVDVLKVQERMAEIEPYLLSVLGQASSVELFTRVDQIATQQGLPKVQEESLRKQASRTADPVERTRLRLALARHCEAQHDVNAARREVQAVYQTDGRSLGVVRAAVDFYWRNRDSKAAIDTLTQAARSAYPGLQRQFALEAARKATDAGDYARARQALEPLLAADRFRPEYVNAMADTYGRTGDMAGLRRYYSETIEALGKSTMPGAARSEQTATLRRALIPVLTRQQEFAAAVDQYIEVVKQYPEDEALAGEAATYAREHKEADRLTSYFTRAVTDSPKDARWPVVLARLQSNLDNPAAGLELYTKAIALRPDRLDLLTARGALEERLLRFDEAARTYTRAYDLAYRDPQWLRKTAEMRARLGQAQPAVEGMEAAYLKNRPATAAANLQIAEALEGWNLIAEARRFAEQALTLQERDAENNTPDLTLYFRIMARLRQYAAASTRTAQFAPNVVADGLDAAAHIVARDYTPEEKTAFATFLGQKRTSAAPEVQQRLVSVALTAQLQDVAAQWLQVQAKAQANDESGASFVQQLNSLQSSRLRSAELGKQLEEVAAVSTEPARKQALLEQVAALYDTAGDGASELRVRTQLFALTNQGSPRYYTLVAQRAPAQLISLAMPPRPDTVRDEAANAGLGRGVPGLAQQLISARGQNRPPVWTKAYTALTGLYYGQPVAQVKPTFLSALQNATVGERIGKPADRQQFLVGETWFYYGARYGEYLARNRQPEAEEYLASTLEATPGRAAAYLELADFYRSIENTAAAVAEYQHALDLDPQSATAQIRLATVYRKQGQAAAARTAEQAALKLLLEQAQGRRTPESFWTDAPDLLRLWQNDRASTETLLRAVVRRGGSYRAGQLAEAAGLDAAGLIALSRQSEDPAEFLAGMIDATWVPAAGRAQLWPALLAASEVRLRGATADQRAGAETTYRNTQQRAVRYFLRQHQAAAAEGVLNSIPEETRRLDAGVYVPLEIQVAAQTKTLDALLAKYAARSEQAPDGSALQSAAVALREQGDAASARKVLVFHYTRELQRGDRNAATYIGLAEVRLEEGKVDEAVALLRRLTLVAPTPFETLEPAATLLLKTGHAQEALPFLQAWRTAVPWSDAAKIQLGLAQNNIGLLQEAAGSQMAAYETRVQAAKALGERKAGAAAAGSAELSLLAGGQTIPPALADSRYFYPARLAAAAQTRDAAARVRLLANAVAVHPEERDARVALGTAASATKQWSMVVAALTPIAGPSYGGGPDEDRSADIPSNPQQAQLLAMLARALTALDRQDEAEGYYNAALRIAPANTRADLAKAAEAARKERERRVEDETRRPVISANLEQPHVVRQRVLPITGGAAR